MSASDTRRGPGWWMDLEGGWNPPEEWPESTPPLPGWTQDYDGRWSPPTDEDGAVREPTERELAREAVAVRRIPASVEEAPVRRSLTYAEVQATPRAPVYARPTTGWAMQAAAIAAVSALMIGLGIAILLVV